MALPSIFSRLMRGGFRTEETVALLQVENRRYRASVTAVGRVPGGGESTQKYWDGGGTAWTCLAERFRPMTFLRFRSSGQMGHRKRGERTKASAYSQFQRVQPRKQQTLRAAATVPAGKAPPAAGGALGTEPAKPHRQSVFPVSGSI
jgi:hypothetical protein